MLIPSRFWETFLKNLWMYLRTRIHLSFSSGRKTANELFKALEEIGLRYFRYGRVLPTGQTPAEIELASAVSAHGDPAKPAEIEELLDILVKGLRRAMYPLTHRRKGRCPEGCWNWSGGIPHPIG
jgi:hypothetical protein